MEISYRLPAGESQHQFEKMLYPVPAVRITGSQAQKCCACERRTKDKIKKYGPKDSGILITMFMDACSMLLSFISVGVESFGVTRKSSGGVSSYQLIEAEELIGVLDILIRTAEAGRESIIIRPFLAPEDTNAIIQLDDLNGTSHKPLVSFSFCITETSPARYQAFLCISNGAEDYALLRRQLSKTANADSGASCAARLAGTLNNKPNRLRDDGTYPHVQLVQAAPQRIVTVDNLKAAGLLGLSVNAEPTRRQRDDPHSRGRRYSDNSPNGTTPNRLPSYQKALESVRIKDDGNPDRSAADLLFAITCLRWRPPVPTDKIASLLLRHSEKVRERGDKAWYIERTIDAAIRAVESPLIV